MIIEFNIEFDGTDMSATAISEKARELGWPGIRICGDEFMRTGRLIIRRLPQSAVYS